MYELGGVPRVLERPTLVPPQAPEAFEATQ